MRRHFNKAMDPGRGRQSGALLFTTPLLMLLVVLLSAMALDGARLYSLREKMQTEVDAAATAAADADQTCGGQNVSLSTMQKRALTAAQAQGFTGDASDLVVQAGVLTAPTKGADLVFVPTRYMDQSNAVRVSYTQRVRISELLPQSWLGGVTLGVNAAVRKQAVATLSAAGSTVNIGGGLLGALLGAVLSPGKPYNLDPTSLSSLENTTVKLGDLLDALDVNSVAALLPLTGRDLANGLDTIASNKGLTGVANLLDSIASTDGIDTVKVSDVLSVAADTSVPSDSRFPLYDVVISLVLNLAKINQSHSGGLLSVPLSVSNLSLGVGPLLSLASIKSLDLALHVGEPPTVAIGPARRDLNGDWMTRFYAPDISLQLNARVQLLKVDVLGLADLSIASLDVPLAVSLGGGYGDFTAAQCARGSANSADVTVLLNRQVARIATGSIDGSTGALNAQGLDARIGKIKVLGVTLADPAIDLGADLDATVSGARRTVMIAPGYPLYCSPDTGCDTRYWQDSGGGLSGLNPDLKITRLSLLGFKLDGLTQGLVDTLQPVLNATVKVLGGTVINPLLRTLGVGLGGISVTVSGVDQNSIQIIENVPLANQSG